MRKPVRRFRNDFLDLVWMLFVSNKWFCLLYLGFNHRIANADIQTRSRKSFLKRRTGFCIATISSL